MAQKIRTATIFGSGLLSGVALSLAVAAAAVEGPSFGLPTEELRRLADLVRVMKQNYFGPLEDKRLMNECLKGMVSGVDPESAYLGPDSFAALVSKAGSAGVGLEIAKEPDITRVIAPIEGSPAFRAGILNGDVILKVDDADTKGMSLQQVVERLRGKPNSEVVLTIRRSGEDQPLTVKLKREPVKAPSVKSGWIEPGYAYVRVSQFQSDTVAVMGQQLNKMFRQGLVEGLVLDLRGNPGGLLNAAIGVSAAYLPANAVVATMAGRAPDANHVYRATPSDYQSGRADDLKGLPSAVKTVPMVVLVNRGSAAASEIVAGALQDNQRATIMGEPTFGRASLQTILPLGNDTAVKLTTARWSTPNGRSLLGKGLTPDILLDHPEGKPLAVPSSDPQVQRAISELKSRQHADSAAGYHIYHLRFPV